MCTQVRPKQTDLVGKEKVEVCLVRPQHPTAQGNARAPILQSLWEQASHHAMFRPCYTKQAAATAAANRRNLLIRHVAAEEAASRFVRRRSIRWCGVLTTTISITAPVWRASVMDTYSSGRVGCVVVAEAGRLHDFKWHVFKLEVNEIASNDGADDQSEEDDKEYKVQNGVSHNSSLAKLGLLERVDRRTDLTTVPC
jgi:hypothetical protein